MNQYSAASYSFEHFRPQTDQAYLAIACKLLEAANNQLGFCGNHDKMLGVHVDVFLAAMRERDLDGQRGAAKAVRRVREARIRAGARAKAVRRARTGA